MRSRGAPVGTITAATKRLARVAIVSALVSGSLAFVPGPGWTAESSTGMREVGFIPATLHHVHANITERAPPPMIVDPEHDLGFAIGNYRLSADSLESGYWLGMYDLKSLRLLDHIRVHDSWGSDDIFRFTIDPARERLLEPMNPENSDPSCANRPSVSTIDYSAVRGRRTLRAGGALPIPCPGLWRIVPSINSIYEDHASSPPVRKLYVYGTYVWEHYRGNVSPDLQDNDGQPLVIQQIDLAKLDAGGGAEALDWQLDLRYAGCGRIAVPFVQRVGDNVFSYCSDSRPAFARSGSLSEQGYVVRIPLDEHDQPVTVGSRIPDPYDPAAPAATNFLVRRTPALAGNVVPFADPVTGTLLLLANDAANGNATWLFDPLAERFVGVITGGDADPPLYKNAAGFDGVRGRTYLFTSTGILMAPTRQRPLPTGAIYDVVSRPDDRAWVTHIAVAPKLRRLFVPLARDANGKGRGGWVVLEDDIPEPPPETPVDPDRNTTQLAERAEATRVEMRGAAIASGAHLIAVGGITRALNTSDPLCDEPAPGFVPATERTYFDDRCLWEVLLASGHRELYLAATAIEAGSTTGAIAEGSGLAFSETDHTDQDLKRAGECYRSTGRDLARGGLKAAGASGEETSALGPVTDQYAALCAGIQAALIASGGPDLSAGTQGPDDEGYPVRHSECAAFDESESDEQPPEEPLRFSSSVTCEPAVVKATADAASAALAIPGLDGPAISVARTTSSVRSLRTARGQETTVEAVAHGVEIGPLQIGEIRTIAATRAMGRTGTAAAEITRRWCRVQLAGEPAIEDCVDPTSSEARALIDQANQALGRVRIDVPDVLLQATPGGYQAVVTKHPEVRAADEAVNDDESHTVPGLQLVVYNDGLEGRNRLILQLAGVHVESRYAIQAIPDLTSSITDEPLPGPGVPSPAAGDAPVRTRPSFPLITRPLPDPVEAIRDAVRLLVNNPVEFALSFLLLTILATPLYLTIRRRMFQTEVTS